MSPLRKVTFAFVVLNKLMYVICCRMLLLLEYIFREEAYKNIEYFSLYDSGSYLQGGFKAIFDFNFIVINYICTNDQFKLTML